MTAPTAAGLHRETGARFRVLLVLAAVLLLRLPFLNQAIQGDDIYYLAGAQHAQIDPLHPTHAKYVYLGELIDMRGHPHPPLNSWFLAGLLAMFGDVREVPFHAAYILFSLIAALSMWSLAKRFTARPLLATLLFLATPAFVVNGTSFEADLPFLAFWMAGIALFLKAGVSQRLSPALAGAAVSLALAALAAYQAVVVVPILALYLWVRARRWWAGWAVALLPVLTVLAWQIFERASTGALPATVLAGYFQSYGLQAIGNKLRNTAALTVHSGWIVFPALAVAAVSRKLGRRAWVLVGAASIAAMALLDPNPLFWVSFGIGLSLLIGCVKLVWKQPDRDVVFLGAWILIFFAAALVLFFAGSARYLLPVAAPVCLLAARCLPAHPRWLIAGFAAQLAVSVGLSLVNYQHWDGYRQFAAAFAKQAAGRRVWINGEWGLRFYLEAEGGLPILQSQAVLPGDVVVSSRLAFPVEFTTGGGTLVPAVEREIRSWLPFRLIALGTRSGYSTATLGLRPFDLGTGPIDVVRAEAVMECKPVREYLPMNAPDAEQQIVSGIYQLESNRWRWMSERGVVLLKRPDAPAPVEAQFYLPDKAPGRRIVLLLDGKAVAEKTYSAPGLYTLSSAEAAAPANDTATLTITVDKTFSAPGDHRRLGLILSAVGFKASR